MIKVTVEIEGQVFVFEGEEAKLLLSASYDGVTDPWENDLLGFSPEEDAIAESVSKKMHKIWPLYGQETGKTLFG